MINCSDSLTPFYPKGGISGKRFILFMSRKYNVSSMAKNMKYKFGNKVFIIRSATDIILGSMSFRNEYDGHTIVSSFELVEGLIGIRINVRLVIEDT